MEMTTNCIQCGNQWWLRLTRRNISSYRSRTMTVEHISNYKIYTMALWKRLQISWLTSSAKHSKPGFKSLLNSFWVDSCETICSWLKVDFTLYPVRNYTWQLAQVLENAATEGQNYATSCSQSGLTSHYEHCPESKNWALNLNKKRKVIYTLSQCCFQP